MPKRKSAAKLKMPTANKVGWLPTLNKTGYNFPGGGPFVKDFIKFAVEHDTHSWVLDLGCAYGEQTFMALREGARVIANDIEPRHLKILRANCPKEFRRNLRTEAGNFADIRLPANSLGAILSRLTLSFMSPESLERSITKMFDALQPGGKAYIMTASMNAAAGLYRLRDEFNARKEAGEKWPGYFADMDKYRKRGGEDKFFYEGMPAYAATSNVADLNHFTGPFHFIEVGTLAKEFRKAGFRVKSREDGVIFLVATKPE